MPPQISDDEKNGWKLGGGSGSLRTKGCIQWNLGTEGNPREMCIRDDYGEIKKRKPMKQDWKRLLLRNCLMQYLSPM